MRFDQSNQRLQRNRPVYRRLITLSIVAGVALLVALIVNLRDARPPGLPPNPKLRIGIAKLPVDGEAPKLVAGEAPDSTEAPDSPPRDLVAEQPVAPPAPLDGAVDLSGIPAVSRKVSEEGLVALFQQIRNDGSWVNEPPLTTPDERLSLRERLINAPEKYQGEAVYVEGQLVSFDRHALPLSLEPLPPGNVSGLDRYFEAFVFDRDHRMLFLVAVWRHSGEPFSDGDSVLLRGRFLQSYVYDVDVDGDGRQEPWGVPVIVGESLTRQEQQVAPLSVSTPLFVSLGVIAVLFVGVLVAVRLISRRGDRRFEKKMEELRAKGRPRPWRRAGYQGRPQEEKQEEKPGEEEL